MATGFIIHLDMDAFFASVEQARDPALRGRPVIVGGGIEGRGVIASASYEARPFGLTAGMPIGRARELCPDGVFLPPDFAAYNAFAGRVFDLLSEVSPSVEQSSLDDAYVDLAGCERIYGAWSAMPLARLPFVRHAEGIYGRGEGRATGAGAGAVLPDACRWAGAVALWLRRRIRAETGLSASIGVATNKLAAKLASGFRKPAGVTVVAPGAEADFVGMMDLKDVPGIGRVTRQRLLRWNVRTVEEARRLPLDLLADAFGADRGAALYAVVRGQATEQGGDVRAGEPPKSISRETTFWNASSDRGFVESMLFYLTERLGRALRREKMLGRTVQVKLRYQDFTRVQCSRSLGRHTDRDEEVFAAARRLMNDRWCRTRRLRLVGVGLTDLRPACAVQAPLFDTPAERSRRIDRCLDGLRDRFGFEVVQRGLSINLVHAAQSSPDPLIPTPARP